MLVISNLEGISRVSAEDSLAPVGQFVNSDDAHNGATFEACVGDGLMSLRSEEEVGYDGSQLYGGHGVAQFLRQSLIKLPLKCCRRASDN